MISCVWARTYKGPIWEAHDLPGEVSSHRSISARHRAIIGLLVKACAEYCMGIDFVLSAHYYSCSTFHVKGSRRFRFEYAPVPYKPWSLKALSLMRDAVRAQDSCEVEPTSCCARALCAGLVPASLPRRPPNSSILLQRSRLAQKQSRCAPLAGVAWLIRDLPHPLLSLPIGALLALRRVRVGTSNGKQRSRKGFRSIFSGLSHVRQLRRSTIYIALTTERLWRVSLACILSAERAQRLSFITVEKFQASPQTVTK